MRRRDAPGPVGPKVMLAVLLFVAFAQIASALGNAHGGGLAVKQHGRSRKWKGRQLFDVIVGDDGEARRVSLADFRLAHVRHRSLFR